VTFRYHIPTVQLTKKFGNNNLFTFMVAFLQVSFDIKPEQMNELEIGSSLERTLGYLKTLLPCEPGFIAARGMYSLDIEGITHLIFETVWDTW
jgi:hypothetical protein